MSLGDRTCGRPTRKGTPCTLGLNAASVMGGTLIGPNLWDAPACESHLTRDERAERQAVRDEERCMDEALEPRCWHWPQPPSWADLSAERNLPADSPRNDGLIFGRFHDGRCAICGTTDDATVDDHDHATGLRRGYLCRSCNIGEGRSEHPIFQKYRLRNPATITGLALPYTGRGWLDGFPLQPWGERIPGWVVGVGFTADSDETEDAPSMRAPVV